MRTIIDQPWPVSIEDWAHWTYFAPDEHPDDVLTVDECELWRTLAEKVEPEPGVVDGGPGIARLDTEIRDVDVHVLRRDEHSADLFDRAARLVNGANNARWRFDLTTIDYAKVLRYRPGQHYVTHVDVGRNQQSRKLTVIAQLSDPADYSGGDVRIWVGRTPGLVPRAQGAAAVFPSWTLHEVCPVESGERWALVVWAEGPPFR